MVLLIELLVLVANIMVLGLSLKLYTEMLKDKRMNDRVAKPMRGGTPDHTLLYKPYSGDIKGKRLTKDGCVYCSRSICDECGPTEND